MPLLHYALFILAYDAWLYWSHRALHKFDSLYRAHAVHHKGYNLKFHIAEHLVLWGPLVISPLLGWGFSLTLLTVVFMATLAIHRRAYNWLNLPVGRNLEVWITPSYHKTHHLVDSTKNYALFLTYWDRVCSTRART